MCSGYIQGTVRTCACAGVILCSGRQYSLAVSRSATSDSATPWTGARQASPPFTISQSLLKLTNPEL